MPRTITQSFERSYISPSLDRPRLNVDFNEMLDSKTVLLSKVDQKTNSDGEIIELSEGLAVYIYEEDPDIDGRAGYLIADGVCMKNDQTGWSKAAKRTCQIDIAGIRRLSKTEGPLTNP